MLIDVEGLEDKVKPQIKNSSKYLGLGKDTLVSISIPIDFSYCTKLRNIPQTILGIDNRINAIENWVNITINNFNNAETNNKGLIEGIISTALIGGKVVEFGRNTASILNSNDFANEIKSSVKGAFDYAFSGEWIIDAFDIAKKTASKVSDKIESAISWTISTNAKIKEKVTNFVSNKIESGLEFVGGKLSDAWNFTYPNIVKPTWNFLKATGASLTNVAIGLIKGFSRLSESLLDSTVMLATGVGSIFTGVSDGITYLVALANDDTEDWSSNTASVWKSVMGYVAKDHVESVFKSFYSNTVVSQYIDENAIDIFKSDGIGTNIASGIGYLAGITALTIATLRYGYCCNKCFNHFIDSSSCNKCYNHFIYSSSCKHSCRCWYW